MGGFNAANPQTLAATNMGVFNSQVGDPQASAATSTDVNPLFGSFTSFLPPNFDMRILGGAAVSLKPAGWF